jgi:hypothetical protein
MKKFTPGEVWWLWCQDRFIYSAPSKPQILRDRCHSSSLLNSSLVGLGRGEGTLRIGRHRRKLIGGLNSISIAALVHHA